MTEPGADEIAERIASHVDGRCVDPDLCIGLDYLREAQRREAIAAERTRINNELEKLKTHLTDANRELTEEAWTTYEVKQIINGQEEES